MGFYNIQRNLVLTCIFRFSGIPEKPIIVTTIHNAQLPRVDDKFILSCETNLTSQPREFHNPLYYTFTRNNIKIPEIEEKTERFTVSGKQLILEPLMKEDSHSYFACAATEVGSKMTSETSDPYILNLRCAA